jgi:transcription antitermination factor NusG
MQKHWYIIYTKPKYEKKVAALLTKKKIENFCPINRKRITQFQRSKVSYEPLFNSYVFANVYENEIHTLKQIENVVNIVYWKGRPAIVQNEEILEIKRFVSDHENIKLEKSKVNYSMEASVIDRPAFAIDGNVIMIKNKSIKINLPSLGFTMVAEMEGQDVIGREVSFGNKEFSLQ